MATGSSQSETTIPSELKMNKRTIHLACFFNYTFFIFIGGFAIGYAAFYLKQKYDHPFLCEVYASAISPEELDFIDNFRRNVYTRNINAGRFRIIANDDCSIYTLNITPAPYSLELFLTQENIVDKATDKEKLYQQYFNHDGKNYIIMKIHRDPVTKQIDDYTFSFQVPEYEYIYTDGNADGMFDSVTRRDTKTNIVIEYSLEITPVSPISSD